MRSFITITILALLWGACKKNKYNVPTDHVISNLSISNHGLVADGKTLDTVSVNLASNADSNRRTVLFTVSDGNFLGGTNGTISSQAYFLNNQLTAKASFVAPLSPTIVYFTASPSNADFNITNRYLLSDTLTVLPSIPASISLQTSNFGIAMNYQGTITLKGLLKNASNNPVSLNTPVRFDVFPSSGTGTVDGQLQVLNALSDSASSVNATYQAGAQAVGSTFSIQVTVLNSDGTPSNITSSVTIKITQ